MSLYTLSGLPIPTGYADATPVKINSNGLIAGTCTSYYGITSAMVWDGGGYTVIGPPGFYGRSAGINSSQILAGNYVDGVITYPFFWNKSTGVLTLLKIPAQNSNSAGAAVSGINDNNQLAGYSSQFVTNPNESCLFWGGLSSNPVSFGNQNVDSKGKGINDNGIIIGSIFNSTDFQGFFGDSATQTVTLIPNSRGCVAINDLANPQILSYSNISGYRSYMYDTLTNTLNDLNTPGNDSYASDINNNSEIVGQSINDGAVLWKGLIKVKLNDPLISDAQIKGWKLTNAIGINDKGHIAGTGIFNGKESPWLLVPKPKFTVHRIPVEYMLPHIVWPGDPYGRAKPKGWPKEFPFPLPKPSPFELVGEAYKIKHEILHDLKIQEMVNSIPEKREGVAIRKIITKLIQQKSQKLNNLIEKSLLARSKSKK